jgi:sarcosine oxidase subunit beta
VRSVSELPAKTVVVAAGADSPRLVPQLPIVREDRYLFYSDQIKERLLEPLVVSAGRHFATKQLGNGRVLASDLAARGDEAGATAWRANIRAGIEELLPQLTYVSFPLLVHGSYDVTPDHQPILGLVEENVYAAAGFSGHGFMIAPAVGRILADAILEGQVDEALGVLDVSRFAENRLVPEPQLV